MKTAIICFSLTGQQTGERLLAGLKKQGQEAVLYKKSKYLPDSIEESVGDWAGRQFQEAGCLIFIGACGIAVRSIASYVAGKKKDPAVLVIDECGGFVISLLSGHLGGANELALRAAGILGAVPVVTTATDLHGRFAVDMFAKKNGCAVFHMKAAKEASAALLAGETVGFYSEFPWEGELPAGLVPCDRQGMPLKAERQNAAPEKLHTGIAVTVYRDCLPFASTVSVVPRAVVLGLGCRRGKEFSAIREMAEEALEKSKVYREALRALASIELKKDEPGLLTLSREWQLPFLTFTEEELWAAAGEFTASAFVRQVTGVDNVCERSAVLGSSGGNLIQRKLAGGGVTAALAMEDWRIRFE